MKMCIHLHFLLPIFCKFFSNLSIWMKTWLQYTVTVASCELLTQCTALKAFIKIKCNICVLQVALSLFSMLPYYPNRVPGHVTNVAPKVNHMTTEPADGKKEGTSETQRNLGRERLSLVRSHRCSLPPP